MMRNLIRLLLCALVVVPACVLAQSAPAQPAAPSAAAQSAATQSTPAQPAAMQPAAASSTAASTTPAQPAAQPGAGQSSAAQPETTFRTSSDLVVVDVTVDDAQQNPVHHLLSTDFTVLEDGKPQTLKFFEEHTPGVGLQFPPRPKLDAGMFTNYTATPAHGALNILLLDKLNTPVVAQTVVRDQVLKYLKDVKPGTPIAIFSLTTDLKLLQGFTSDPQLLRDLVIGKKGSQQASPVMTDAMNGDEPGADDPMMDMMNDALGNDPNLAEVIADLQQFEAETQAFQLQLRQRYTLDALNQLARFMSGLPGRKNLIWFSGSFPIDILPDPDLKDPFAIVSSAQDEFRETVDMLSRAQVSVYPIDARGLMTIPMLNANNSGQSYMPSPSAGPGGTTRTPPTSPSRGAPQFAKDSIKFFSQTAAEQGTLKSMADATGGKAFLNTNGLKEAVEQAVNAGSNYYTLAYTPANREWKGDYRKIQIKLDQPGATLAYRHGYFADDPMKLARVGAPAGEAQYSAFLSAMQHGGPEPTQLIFIADVRPSSADTEVTLAEGNQASKKASGPYRRYTVTFIANPRQLHCDVTADGLHHCALEFLSVVYDDDGKPVVQQSDGIHLDVQGDHFAAMLKQNVAFTQQISAPAKGDYFLRAGMRDQTNDRVGAVELPIAAVAKLTPVPAQASTLAARPTPPATPAQK